MLASGSPANASSAAARIAATLRSASRRLRRGAGAGVVLRVTSVNGHRAWVEAELRHEVAGGGEDGERDQAGETSEHPGCHERVGDPGGSLGPAERSGGACGDRREDGDADRAADLVTRRVEAGDHS